MDAVPFKEANMNLGPPKGHKETEGLEDCMDLPVYRSDDQNIFISKHQLTTEERDELLKTGCIWLYVFGNMHPPIALTTKYPFIKVDNS